MAGILGFGQNGTAAKAKLGVKRSKPSPYGDAQLIDVSVLDSAESERDSWRHAFFGSLLVVLILGVGNALSITKDHTEVLVYGQDATSGKNMRLLGYADHVKPAADNAIAQQLGLWVTDVRTVTGLDDPLIDEMQQTAQKMIERPSQAWNDYVDFIQANNQANNPKLLGAQAHHTHDYQRQRRSHHRSDVADPVERAFR